MEEYSSIRAVVDYKTNSIVPPEVFYAMNLRSGFEFPGWVPITTDDDGSRFSAALWSFVE
jgi:hypothetical protein